MALMNESLMILFKYHCDYRNGKGIIACYSSRGCGLTFQTLKKYKIAKVNLEFLFLILYLLACDFFFRKPRSRKIMTI